MEDRNKPLQVALTYNLKKSYTSEDEAEYDDISTIEAIKEALQTIPCEVKLVEVSENPIEQLLSDRPDIVFNIAEGTNGRGREAQIPAILNFLGIPFTGSDETTMCLTLDKQVAKILVSSYGIKTPRFKVISSNNYTIEGLSYPLIVKPNAEGSSKGILSSSIAKNKDELKSIVDSQFSKDYHELLIEEYIDGREFTVGLLGNGDSVKVFKPMEIVFKNKKFPIYSYDVKKDFKKYVDYTILSDIKESVLEELTLVAKKIYDIFHCYDMARIDFRVDSNDEIYFIEINPLPGLAPNYSDFPMLAELGGTDYTALILEILRTALIRNGISYEERGK